MRCGKINRWISAEIDGVLPVYRKKLVEQHLSECQKCAEYQVALVAQERDIINLDFPKVADDFYAQIRLKLPQKQEGVEFVPSWLQLRWASVAVVISIGLVLGGMVALNTANRFLASKREDVSDSHREVDEFVYFSAIPASFHENDFFRDIVYESEESAQ